ncbi:hypothetical protein D3C87_839190 [compost metagenome]
MSFVHNDGGRAAAGFKGRTGDCVTRAIAIATETEYKTVYDALNRISKEERITKRKPKKSNSRTGVWRDTAGKYLESLGWVWVPTMRIGSGCKVHLNPNELPCGRIVVKLSHHMAAVVDGVLHDTYDSSRDGTRCVYGYYCRR